MNYYKKYLKYKIKYLNLLNGGTVPQIDCDLLPFEKTNINIIYQSQFILKNNNHNDNNYLLNNDYKFEKTQIQINQPLFNTSDLSMLADLYIKLGCDFIPFHVASLQFNFNIIIGVLYYISYATNDIKLKKIDKNGNIRVNFVQYISNKIFNIVKVKVKCEDKDKDSKSYILLGISNKNTILNCFSFFNKLHEFLNYLLLNDYNQDTIDKLFPNIENIKDFYNIYSYFYDIKDKECTIKKYLQSSRDTFYEDISKFNDFINNCNIIDKHIEFKTMFGISLINLILINWIHLRSLKTNLVIGSLSSNLYPINRVNFLENIFQMNEKSIYDYTEEQKQLKKKNDINKLLLDKIDVPIIPYGQSTYKGHNFPNCVENTILQLLKILAWKDNKYNIEQLPNGISVDITNIIKRINNEPLKIETKEIMDDFVILVSGIPNIIYRNNDLNIPHSPNDHNIASNKGNVGNILNYIFNGITVEGGIEDYNNKIFKIINDNSEVYSLHQKDNIIIIDNYKFKINIIIEEGHATIDNKIDDIYRELYNYKYLKLLYIFNYTKDDSINFQYEFYNFCYNQNNQIKNFIIDKILKIQNISLTYYNSRDERGNSCLHIACFYNNLEKLKYYIKKKYADVNCINNMKQTPLFIATDLNNIEIIQLLIINCANVNSINVDKETPLYRALLMKHFKCAKLLIDNHASVNQTTNTGNTPLLLVSKNGNLEYIKLLIDKGADIHHHDYDHNTPIINATKSGNIDCIEFLIKIGVNINNINKQKETPLSIASEKGNIICLKLLIDYGADINNRNQKDPVYEATAKGYCECVKLLIDNGADLNIGGETSLLIASKNGYLNCIKLLIENHVNINCRNPYGETPFYWASRKGHKECLQFLIDNGATYSGSAK
jgi:ankyrin repeat protein